MARWQARTSSTLTIFADGAEVRRAADWLERSGCDLEVPPAQIERLDLCLHEALANVISHSGVPPHETVSLRLDVRHLQDGHEASVTIMDSGSPFDVTKAKSKAAPVKLADADPGGLGLLMIRSNCDAMTHARRNGHNELSITVRWLNAH
ncbi:MAG: hypothetical protein IOMNBAOH_02710 [Rhodocyclaceae bacterium]|nr:hypothetical protein [Rhodocyclaceae bacterium]